jgi:hypothetical protein
MNRLHQILSKYWFIIALLGFVIARVYIFQHPPEYVRYFEEYANIWHYGWPPYLKHWFEYPPATIPFISLPLDLDLAGVGKYRLNFRVMMLIVDTLVFLVMLKAMSKLKYNAVTKLANTAFYLLITVKAKDFMYENLDMLFALSLIVPAVVPLFMKKGKEFFQWLLYWFGTGIKLVNAPLALLYFYHSNKPLKYRLILPIITFLLIWAAPLAIYRSSLSVVYVYHKNRTMQVESIPALIVRGINIFTKTETIYISQYKSYDIKGPISDKALPLANIALVISMLVMAYYIYKNRDKAKDPIFLMKVTLIFTFSYLVTNKVFSTPYHLWYLGLVAIFPYKNWRERLSFFVAAALFAGVATTRIPNTDIGPTNLSTLLPVLIQIPASWFLLVSSYGLEVQPEPVATTVVPATATAVKKKPTKKSKSKKK